MRKKTVALVAQDFSPSKAFALVEAELESRGWDALSLLGIGKEQVIADEIDRFYLFEPPKFRILQRADIVLIGMSSSPDLARGEVDVAKTVHEYGPHPMVLPDVAPEKRPQVIGAYADIWGCAGREWFESVRHTFGFALAADECVAEEAHDVFPNVGGHVSVCGNPLWDAAQYVSVSRDEARQQLGVSDGRKVVLCALTKIPAVNQELLSALGHIADYYSDVTCIATLHPGDQTDPNEYTRPPIRIAADMRTPDVLPAANLVLNGTSNVGIQATRLGIPVAELQGTAITQEEARLYPDGWRLPETRPDLVHVACPDTIIGITDRLLKRPLRWRGIVGEPPAPLPSVAYMADAIEAAYDRLFPG